MANSPEKCQVYRCEDRAALIVADQLFQLFEPGQDTTTGDSLLWKYRDVEKYVDADHDKVRELLQEVTHGLASRDDSVFSVWHQNGTLRVLSSGARAVSSGVGG